ncbi:MAG: hypothetical protein ACR2FY_25260 [Pirellulaceae bacterium]
MSTKIDNEPWVAEPSPSGSQDFAGELKPAVSTGEIVLSPPQTKGLLRMRTILNSQVLAILVGVIISACTISALSQLGPGIPLHRVDFVEESLDLGELLSPGTNARRIRVFNASESDIELSRVETSCDCTAVGRLPIIVRGNSFADIPISITLKDVKGKNGQEVFSGWVRAFSGNGSWNATIKGTIVYPLQISRLPLDLGLVDTNLQGYRRIALPLSAVSPFEVQSVEIDFPAAAAGLVCGQKNLIEVHLPGIAPEREYAAELRVRFSKRSRPVEGQATIPIRWRNRGGLTLAPKEINFGLVEVGKPVEAVFDFVIEDAFEPVFTSVLSSSSAVSGSPIANDGAKDLHLTLKCSPKFPAIEDGNLYIVGRTATRGEFCIVLPFHFAGIDGKLSNGTSTPHVPTR